MFLVVVVGLAIVIVVGLATCGSRNCALEKTRGGGRRSVFEFEFCFRFRRGGIIYHGWLIVDPSNGHQDVQRQTPRPPERGILNGCVSLWVRKRLVNHVKWTPPCLLPSLHASSSPSPLSLLLRALCVCGVACTMPHARPLSSPLPVLWRDTRSEKMVWSQGGLCGVALLHG